MYVDRSVGWSLDRSEWLSLTFSRYLECDLIVQHAAIFRAVPLEQLTRRRNRIHFVVVGIHMYLLGGGVSSSHFSSVFTNRLRRRRRRRRRCHQRCRFRWSTLERDAWQLPPLRGLASELVALKFHLSGRASFFPSTFSWVLHKEETSVDGDAAMPLLVPGRKF